MTMGLFLINNNNGLGVALRIVIVLLGGATHSYLFASAQTCPSICGKENELLNPNDVVQIGTASGPCRFFDTNSRSITDSTVCAEYSQEAIDAGCKCGEPFDCGGICLDDSEELLNPTDVVVIDDSPSPCAGLDITFKSVIVDPEQCTSFSKTAIEAGCKCGIPIECDGICSTGLLLNPDMIVTIDGTTANCSVFDENYKSGIIDPEACTESSNDAIAAGCKCGEPIDCPGICSSSFFGAELANPDDTITIDDDGTTTTTCGEFDGRLQNEIIDPDVCSEMIQKAIDQGCVCGGSQSAAPSTNKMSISALLAASLLIATNNLL